MDPNANLRDQESALADIEWERDHLNDPGTMKRNRRRLRELRQALRDWLRSGGLEPKWESYPRALKHYRKHLNKSVVYVIHRNANDVLGYAVDEWLTWDGDPLHPFMWGKQARPFSTQSAARYASLFKDVNVQQLVEYTLKPRKGMR